MDIPCFVGIDVAKARFDIAVRPRGEQWTAAHDATGIAALVDRLVALAPTLVVLEATGGREVSLVAALAAAGVPVAVVNPRQVRRFAQAVGQLAKTDALDARSCWPASPTWCAPPPGRCPTPRPSS
jgi:transposase